MANFKPKSVLITGGAGFIGANFIHYMLTHYPDLKIVNFDKLTYAGTLANLTTLPATANYHFVQGDIVDATHVRHVLKQHAIDTIVHFAAESHVDRSITTPEIFIDTNIKGTYQLLEAARELWLQEEKRGEDEVRFHHISTDEVFGSLQPSEPAFTELTPYQPRSPYSASKASSDHLVLAFYHTYGLPVTLSNCSNNYGPLQHAEKFIPTIIRACLTWQPIPIYGNGSNVRDWLYVLDHCRGIDLILQNGRLGESYNIGGDNEWENIKVAEYICQQFDHLLPKAKPYASLINLVNDRAGHDFRYAINANKIRQALGWQAQESFACGMTKTIDFYRQHFL